MKKRVVLFLADGFEEVEALSPLDYLRRADIDVCSVAVGNNPVVKGAHGIGVAADALLTDLEKAGKLKAEDWDGVLLPGGIPGASNIAASAGAGAVIKDFAAKGKLVGAICAAPAVVLFPLGLLAGRRFTCYPGFEKNVQGAEWSGDRVVVDGKLITSRGAGTAGEWAYTLIKALLDESAAEKLAQGVLLRV